MVKGIECCVDNHPYNNDEEEEEEEMELHEMAKCRELEIEDDEEHKKRRLEEDEEEVATSRSTSEIICSADRGKRDQSWSQVISSVNIISISEYIKIGWISITFTL